MIFAINISLKDHISSEHEKNKSYECPVFKEIFAVIITLKSHTLRPVDDATKGSTQEAPMCEACFLKKLAK